jgi:hypothetical protein
VAAAVVLLAGGAWAGRRALHPPETSRVSVLALDAASAPRLTGSRVPDPVNVDGVWTWELEPGSYRVERTGGEPIEFDVPPGRELVLPGTGDDVTPAIERELFRERPAERS